MGMDIYGDPSSEVIRQALERLPVNPLTTTSQGIEPPSKTQPPEEVADGRYRALHG